MNLTPMRDCAQASQLIEEITARGAVSYEAALAILENYSTEQLFALLDQQRKEHYESFSDWLRSRLTWAGVIGASGWGINWGWAQGETFGPMLLLGGTVFAISLLVFGVTATLLITCGLPPRKKTLAALAAESVVAGFAKGLERETLKFLSSDPVTKAQSLKTHDLLNQEFVRRQSEEKAQVKKASEAEIEAQLQAAPDLSQRMLLAAASGTAALSGPGSADNQAEGEAM